MKKLLFLLLLGIPSFASVTQVQVVGAPAASCGNATLLVCTSGTLAPIGAGHLIVVEHFNNQTSGTAVSAAVCGADTLTNSVGASLANVNGSMSLWYILNSSAGATTCVLTLSGSNSGRGLVVYEFSSNLTSPTFTVDSGAGPAQVAFTAGSCTNCVGVTLTIAGANDVMVQGTVGAVVSGVSSPWTTVTNYQNAVSGRYATSNLNTASGSPPTYTNGATSNTFQNGAAFTENGSGGGGSFIANQSVFAVGP